MQVVKDFVTKMCNTTNVQDRLHVIWFDISTHHRPDHGLRLNHGRFCIEIGSNRIQQQATQGVFSALAHISAIPIIVVGTKKDRHWNEKFGESRANFGNLKQLENHCDKELAERLESLKDEVYEVEGGRFDAFVPVSKGPSCLTLAKTIADTALLR